MENHNNQLDKYITPPLLEYFKLEGLNGYKTIEIRFEKNIKILAADNGAGKTTLMNALYATLTGKLSTLSSIDFTSMVIPPKKAST